MKTGEILGLLAAFAIGGYICYRYGKTAIAAPPAIPAGLTAYEFEEANRMATEYGWKLDLVVNQIILWKPIYGEAVLEMVERYLSGVE